MSSYLDRTLIVFKNTGKLSLYSLGAAALGVILVPTITIMFIQKIFFMRKKTVRTFRSEHTLHIVLKHIYTYSII